MLERETAEDGGSQVRLRPQGLTRFVPAALLSLWLCGWAMGECVAAGLLFSVAPHPFAPGALTRLLPHARFHADGRPVMVGFVALWLAVWTLGGIAAFSGLLHILFGSEVVRWDTEAIEVRRLPGLSGIRARIPFTDLRELRSTPFLLLAITGGRPRPIAMMGSFEDREELAGMLREAARAAGASLVSEATSSATRLSA